MGELIRARRKQKGLTLKQLAVLSGLSHPFISLVERGRARPSLPSFTNLARALDTTPVDLLAALNPPPSSVGHPELVTVTRGSSRAPTYGNGSGQLLISVPGRVRMMEVHSEGVPTGVRLSHDDVDEYLYILAGSIEAHVDDQRHVLGVGDTIRVPAGSLHNWWTSDGQPYRLLMTSVFIEVGVGVAVA